MAFPSLYALQSRLRIRFGFDAFIAYNRGSASGYARKLYESLTGNPYRLVCFIDERGFMPGSQLRPRTILTMLFSYMLIVVFTRQARESPHVRREVSLFLWLRKWFFWNRPVSILDVEGEWQRVLAAPDAAHLERPWRELRQETRRTLLLYEVEPAFATGEPSLEIRERYGGWKQFTRLRRRDINVVLGSATAAIVLALAAAGLAWAAGSASSSLRQTKAKLDTAQTQLSDTQKRQTETSKALEATRKQLGDTNTTLVNTMTTLGQTRSDLATETQRLQGTQRTLQATKGQLRTTKDELRDATLAKQKADIARSKAVRLASLAGKAREYAVALKLGAQAQESLAVPSGGATEIGVLLAAESLNRQVNLDGFRAMINGLTLLPRPTGSQLLWRGTIGDAFVAPGSRYAVMPEGEDDNARFVVKEMAHGAETGSITPHQDHPDLVAFRNSLNKES